MVGWRTHHEDEQKVEPISQEYVARAWHNELPEAACEIISHGRVPTGANLVCLASETATPSAKELPVCKICYTRRNLNLFQVKLLA